MYTCAFFYPLCCHFRCMQTFCLEIIWKLMSCAFSMCPKEQNIFLVRFANIRKIVHHKLLPLTQTIISRVLNDEMHSCNKNWEKKTFIRVEISDPSPHITVHKIQYHRVFFSSLIEFWFIWMIWFHLIYRSVNVYVLDHVNFFICKTTIE